MMNRIKKILTLLLFFTPTLSFGADSCIEVLSLTVVSEPYYVLAEAKPNLEQQQPIKLNDGDTYWGYYECASCETEVSTMPGERQCLNCGKPHTVEPLDKIEPAIFRKTTRVGNNISHDLYLVNPGRLSKDKAMHTLAEEGEVLSCPFCGVGGFDIEVQCSGCGAEVDNKTAVKDYLNDRVRSRNRREGNTPVVSSTMHRSRQTLAGIQKANGIQPRESKSIVGKKVVATLIGASMMVTTSLGIVWGTTKYTKTGEVIDISSSAVTVEYVLDNGIRKEMDLKRPEVENVKWRLGEELELYFVNWKLGNPSGAERSNGDVHTPK